MLKTGHALRLWRHSLLRTSVWPRKLRRTGGGEHDVHLHTHTHTYMFAHTHTHTHTHTHSHTHTHTHTYAS